MVDTVHILAVHFIKQLSRKRFFYGLLVLFYVLVALATYTGYNNYTLHNINSNKIQAEVRQHWEGNPDKHPHRMAHYGSYIVRLKHPLSFFDFGIESYAGNIVYLEAHKQNTSNFSQASISNGILRFGEISLAFLWQSLLPLILIFIGYNAVTQQRENGTLKILVSQGATMYQVILGYWWGLLIVASLFMAPIILLLFGLGVKACSTISFSLNHFLLNALVTVVAHFIFIVVVAGVVVLVSATSKQSKLAIIKLLASWLIFVVLLPKGLQAVGLILYPSPSKIAFHTMVENDIIKQGDSHNPNDPHYQHLKDSLLEKFKVDSVQKLPFNYSGVVMREGEKISAEIYNSHLQQLLNIYEQQNSINGYSAFVNPFAAVRQVSMIAAGTSSMEYTNFLTQVENYRYSMAQSMNELQISLISNKKLADTAKPYTISSSYWKKFPDFKYSFLPPRTQFRGVIVPILMLIAVWLFLVLLVKILGKNLNPL
jgi:ABC-2 type transport system permease protein